jgi:hypothetical protein
MTYRKPTAQNSLPDSTTSMVEEGTPTIWARIHGSSAFYYGCLALGAITALVVGFFVGYSTGDLPIPKQPDVPSMSQCVADTVGLFGQKNLPTSEAFRDARDHCYSLIHAQGLINDFAIRKLNFFQQYRANGILMWMVVAVTFSGVLLAAFQIWASFQLADASKASLQPSNIELIVKRNQLVLKSSVTGLFILLLSLCFFLVFVIYVYRFDNLTDQNSVAPPIGPMLPMGGLGPPPTGKANP